MICSGLNIEEHFLGFLDVSSKKTAEGLANNITAVLKIYNIENELVSQTCDSDSVMAGHHGRDQILVHQQCS